MSSNKIQIYFIFYHFYVDKPFTVLSPQNKPTISAEVILSHPDTVKETLLDHIVLGQKLRLDDVSGAFHFRTLGGKIVSVQEINGEFHYK